VKRGLGKSLDEIISAGVKRPPDPVPRAVPPLHEPAPRPAVEGGPSTGIVRYIPLGQIQPNPRQPRSHFDEAALAEMVASIREHGVLQPVTVRQGAGGGAYQLIAGERRWRAAQIAGLTEIPAMVRTADDANSLQLALIENLQREDLNPIEEAIGYHELSRDFNFTQEMIAAKVGKDRATVANAIRLLQLPERLRQYIAHGQLSAGHAKALLGLESEELQVRVAESVIRDGLNVRATERLIRSFVSVRRPRSPKSAAAAESQSHLKALEDALQQKLGTRVKIVSKGKQGRIEIEYFTPEDLDRLLQQLGVSL
jgi:ParB family chromosome partitioning protein